MKQPITFGKYLLVERINVGGMAEVYKAKMFGVAGFERMLAIKRILPSMADDVEFINMFIDEARIAVQLDHVNIVPIYELGSIDGQYYIAMEYVQGKDLRQVLDKLRTQQQVMPIPTASYIVSKLCEGLDYAHHKLDKNGKPLQLVHRDVSPQNILLSYEGAVKITDFGIVKAEDRASKTQAGVLKGKFGYMSPEQVRGLDIDKRSDIFAVGILLYEMCTGKRLFVGESDFSTLERVRNAEVIPPSQHNQEISPAFEAVMLKTLARDREQRYQTAMALHDDLQPFLIDGQNPFNASKLRTFLKEKYQEDIAIELQQMEELAHIAPPANMQESLLKENAANDWLVPQTEKTIIFESGFNQVARDAKKPDDEEDTEPDNPQEPVPQDAAAQPPVAVYPQKLPYIKYGLVATCLIIILCAVLIKRYNANHHSMLTIISEPTHDVNLFIDDQLIGRTTPLTYRDIVPGEHTLLARAEGFHDKVYHFDLEKGAKAQIKIYLDAIQKTIALPVPAKPSVPEIVHKATPVNTKKAPRPSHIEHHHSKQASASNGACRGSGALLSVMPVEMADCAVSVGKINLGVAPFFKKDSPVGRCQIIVRCPDNKNWQDMRVLKDKTEEKIIIKSDDWR